MIGAFIVAIVFFLLFRAIGLSDTQSFWKNLKETLGKERPYITLRIIVIIIVFIIF